MNVSTSTVFTYDTDFTYESNFTQWYSLNCSERRLYNEAVYSRDEGFAVFESLHSQHKDK